jgi:hypothetical protein
MSPSDTHLIWRKNFSIFGHQRINQRESFVRLVCDTIKSGTGPDATEKSAEVFQALIEVNGIRLLLRFDRFHQLWRFSELEPNRQHSRHSLVYELGTMC